MTRRAIQLPDDVVDLHRAGVSIAELARRYSVSRATVTKCLQERGVASRPQSVAAEVANRRRAFPSRPVPLPRPGARQRQISVRFPVLEWEAIAAHARRAGYVRSDGEPILGLAIRELVNEALARRVG